jgi:DNA-binding NarL/FixJ family response regulator
MIRVLIADDQDMVRIGFRMILDAQDDIEVVADVADGVAAVGKARELRPESACSTSGCLASTGSK